MSKDHYVSKTYLSNFSNSKGLLIPYYKNGYVTIGKPKSTSSVCFEVDGDYNEQFEDPCIVNEYLKLFENNWSTNVAALTNMKGTLDVKYGIAGYVAFLQRCTPTAKRMAQDLLTDDMQPLIEGTIKQVMNDPELEPGMRNILEEYQEEKNIDFIATREHAHAIAIETLVDAANGLFCSDWLILFNYSETPFITSDNPVVLYYEDNNHFAKTFVPLSPKLGVLITPSIHEGPPTKINIKEFKHENDINRQIKDEYVHVFNELIVRSAEKLVLHREKEEWLKELVEKNKTWRMELIISRLGVEDSFITKYSMRAVDTKIRAQF